MDEKRIKEWEIWIEGAGTPTLVGKMEASSFFIACLLYELKSRFEAISTMDRNGRAIPRELIHDGYIAEQQVSPFVGKYYKSKEEIK